MSSVSSVYRPIDVSISLVRSSMTMSLRRIALNWRHEEDRRGRTAVSVAVAILCHPHADGGAVRLCELVRVDALTRLEEHDAPTGQDHRVRAELEALGEVVADHHEGVLRADLRHERVEDVHSCLLYTSEAAAE